MRSRTERRLTAGLSNVSATASLISRTFPSAVAESRELGDAVVAHRIRLFGRTHQFEEDISWTQDPVSGAVWPHEHYTSIAISPGRGADPRRVWELNRLHHLVVLGRAYALTGDELYAAEFVNQLAWWYQQNPPRIGINWTVAMEAGIRAVNLIAAFEMFRGSVQVTDRVIELFLKVIIAHERFILSNLEKSYLGSSNHYLGDLIGLLAIGVTIPELSASDRLARFAARELKAEIRRQVLDDGSDYEGSIGYHRLVLEFFALGLQLQQAFGMRPGEAYSKRLKSMFDFVRGYLKPDGTAPAIGDSDDGRLLSFRPREPGDHRYLMSIAAGLFEDGSFKQSIEPDEEMLWWLGSDGLQKFQSAGQEDATGSRAFERAQVFVQRSDSLYAIIDCGDHGVRGHGSHAHSDALSLEVFAYGSTFLRDPGTYVYSASECRRNLFRSTAYHNTVRVDRREISQILPGRLFSLGQNVRPKVRCWDSSDERDVLDVEHYAYKRLSDPVIHRRVVTFDKIEGCWTLHDFFDGRGEHLFEVFFNLDSEVRAKLLDGKRALADTAGASMMIIPVTDLAFEVRIKRRWNSPAYGTRVRSSAIIYSLRAHAPLDFEFLLLPFAGESGAS